MSVVSARPGAVTSSGATVTAKITGGSARLVVADNSAMSGPVFFGPVVPTSTMAKLTATGLSPTTQYWFQIEDDGVIDTGILGKFFTHPTIGSAYNFTVTVGGCAGLNPTYPGPASTLASNRLSDHPVYDTLRNLAPLIHLNTGDQFYYDLGSGLHGIAGGGSLTNYRRAWDDVHSCARFAHFAREIPQAYVWDDHDYGPNNSDGSLATKANAAQVYRERIPHYPLPDTGAVYHAFQIGRVQFVLLDQRYYRDPVTDPAPRSMLGAGQLTWFENILATSTSEFLVTVFPQPIVSEGTNSWGSYPEERSTIYQMIGDHEWTDRMWAVSGDQHQFGLDSGAHTNGFPIFTMNSIDSSTGSLATATYNLGAQAGRGQFGKLVTVDTPESIEVTAGGWVH